MHWDREWYAPFEVMRFQLVQFFDELVDTMEAEPDLAVFLLDGQAVILEDYLEIRRSQRDRVTALVRAGRLRPGPCYVQPDEFHVSGESLVRNFLIGCQVSREFGWVMREGYLPDTFGHVHQLPQILRGFGISTFYAMRGFSQDLDETGSQFWWQAPDGSRVLVEWLHESYSNSAVLSDDAATMQLHHGALVRYDSLPELLDRLGSRAPTGVLLLLNGGDHLRVQHGVAKMVRSLDRAVEPELRLGGLEEFSELVAQRPLPERVETGELRYGVKHDVFDGIGSTRTPMKRHNERTEAALGVAERLDALATATAGGRSAHDSLHHAWRELIKNYAHDSICGCSVDEVHAEMETRFTKVAQIAGAVTEHALTRLARAAAGDGEGIPLVVVNPSAFARTGPVTAEVVPDLDAPLGTRRFGWTQGAGTDWSRYRLLDPAGRAVPFAVEPARQVTVVDALDRRKEVLRDRISFVATDAPPLGTAGYRLVPGAGEAAESPSSTRRGPGLLDNGVLRVEVAPDATVSLTRLGSGDTFTGLLELLDDADAGDSYGFGPLPDDKPLSSRDVDWSAPEPAGEHGVALRGVWTVPAALGPDRRSRSEDRAALAASVLLTLAPGSDVVEVAVTIDNAARDHRIRLRVPTATGAGESLSESAFGVVRRGALPDGTGWREAPSGVFALRRFVATEDGRRGLQILTEGLHEYACDATGTVDVTVLRSVGWLATTGHPLRPHKIGPELATPAAQCPGTHTFRVGLRPYAPEPGFGHLYRAAERFAVPLLAVAVQGEAPGPVREAAAGLAVEPADVVLSAVKTAEDGEGIVVRVFNSAVADRTAVLRPGFAVQGAWACDLEENRVAPLPFDDGAVRLPLRGDEIATVRLVPSEGGQRWS
ncbi:alpha-mannosidase [Pseudonocardia nigra]|uniref:alpha-mannosidase n=1 Tax=Pseudonocardia nigra TaxID=1921578 RepID=UPI001C5F2AC6|nr:glycosyl hydrolase-related protein [Pseudonocardia nigra]